MKKVILFLLLLMPVLIKADTCDYAKHNEYDVLSSNIKYEVKLNKETNKYTVTLYNIYKDIYITYNSKIYNKNSKNEIVISNISAGQELKIKVHSPSDDCVKELRTINIQTNHYNYFYNDERCKKYRDVLNICKYEYLSYPVTESLLSTAIKNYENAYVEPEKEAVVEEEPTILDNIKDFMIGYGIPIILLVITSAVTITIFKLKFRKLKHGI